MNFFKRLFSIKRRPSGFSNGNGYFPFLFSQESTSDSGTDGYNSTDYSVDDQNSFNGFGGGDFGGGGASDSWGDSGGGDSSSDGGGGDGGGGGD